MRPKIEDGGWRIAAFYFAIIYLLSSILLLSSCSLFSHPRHAPKAIHAPPPAIATAQLSRTVQSFGARAGSAKTRVEYVIETVEKIVKVSDPATAEALAAVQGELFKVQADLREAVEAAELARVQTAQVEEQSVKVTAWGVGQQELSEKNAEGWRAEETAHKKDVDKLKATIAEKDKKLHFWHMLAAIPTTAIVGFGLFKLLAAFGMFGARALVPL